MPPLSIYAPFWRLFLRSHPNCLSPWSLQSLNSNSPSLYPRNDPLRSHSTHPSSSADPTEISHFTSLASTWWDPHGSSRILHLMNPLRIQFINRCLSSSGDTSPQEGRYTYLDVGCGGGILSESLARLRTTKSVLGIDPTPAVLGIAEAHLRQDPMIYTSGKLKYLNTTIDDLHEGEFDIVTAMEVIEHVPSPRAFVYACLERVKPGGWLIGSTIARSWVSFVTTKVLAEGVLRVVPWGTHEWGRYVDVGEVREWVGEMEGRKLGSEGEEGERWYSDGEVWVMGCVYVPGVGWREVKGGEKVGNYFFGVRRAPVEVDEPLSAEKPLSEHGA